MRFLRSGFGQVFAVLVIAWLLLVGYAGFRVHQITHPARKAERELDLEGMRIRVESVSFSAVDGPRLSGWFVHGGRNQPPVVLCHDLGQSKSSLINLAIELNGRGFPVLLFDFRGHGESDGNRSTLGIDEKRDILGAVDYLGDRLGGELRRVGVYGVGMGAHAAVLAAGDRSAIRVLVLDSLYPDPGFRLARRAFSGWEPAVRRVGFLPGAWFTILGGRAIERSAASDTVGGLIGRDLLFVVSATEESLIRELHRMVESIPDQPDVDGNLVVLPATQEAGLYGEEVQRYHEEVGGFFSHRLGEP